MLEEAIGKFHDGMHSFQKDINELRTLVIEDRAKSALIVGGVPTVLSLLIGALGLWVQTK
jgi:Flp pilus assembly protein TadB